MELFRNFGFSRVRVPRRGAFHSGLARALVKRGQRRERNFRSSLAFSRAQARSAPRAHERELLCVSQSSKERLRRSRTESSGAAPAIEDCRAQPGNVRPGGPHAEKLTTSFGLLTGEEVWRASGPPAPATIKFLRKFEYPPLPRPRPAEVGISWSISKLFRTFLFYLKNGEFFKSQKEGKFISSKNSPRDPLKAIENFFPDPMYQNQNVRNFPDVISR